MSELLAQGNGAQNDARAKLQRGLLVRFHLVDRTRRYATLAIGDAGIDQDRCPDVGQMSRPVAVSALGHGPGRVLR